MSITATVVAGAAEQILALARKKMDLTVTVEIINRSSRGLISDNWSDPNGNVYFTSRLPDVPPPFEYEIYDNYPHDLSTHAIAPKSAVLVEGMGKLKAAFVWRFTGKANLYLLAALWTAAINDNWAYFKLSNGHVNAENWIDEFKRKDWVAYNQLKTLDTTEYGIALTGEMTNDRHAVLTINLADA